MESIVKKKMDFLRPIWEITVLPVVAQNA